MISPEFVFSNHVLRVCSVIYELSENHHQSCDPPWKSQLLRRNAPNVFVEVRASCCESENVLLQITNMAAGMKERKPAWKKLQTKWMCDLNI